MIKLIAEKEVRPFGKKIAVAVNLNQKSDYEIDIAGGIRIFMNSSFGSDGKIKNPSIAEVISPGDSKIGVKQGDVILCHHNTFAMGEMSGKLIGDTHIKTEDGRSVFVISDNLVFMKIDTNGDAHPIGQFITVERIDHVIKSTLIIPESAKKKEATRFKVIEVGPEVEGIYAGDVIICMKYSDYEMQYSFNFKQRSCIRVKASDVVAKQN